MKERRFMPIADKTKSSAAAIHLKPSPGGANESTALTACFYMVYFPAFLAIFSCILV